jgi:putative zinc ribbon protein/hemerythrin HHE cation binding domain-containing protein
MSATQRLASGYWVSSWPELVAEWHPTRNGGTGPWEVSHGSGRKVWWKCSHGPDHEWRASPNNRTAGGTGCPFCAGRRVSVTNNLATLRPDLAKQWHPKRNGELGPEDVVAGSTRPFWWKCAVAPDHEWRVSPHDRLSLTGGCPFCLDLRVCSTNSLAATRPLIAAEWHSTKNLRLTPHDVVEGSAHRVWWRCSRLSEHEWCASVSNRTVRASGCPFCAGRRASPEHCLAIVHPAIGREWHPTRNGALTPTTVTPHARRKVWWMCSSGHEWRTRISIRTRRRSSCPVCSGRTPIVSPAQPHSHAGDRISAVRDIRDHHGRIEQILLLLVADPGVEDQVLSGFVADLTAQLEAEASILYPALERALGPLTAVRKLQHRLQRALSRIVLPDGGDTVRRDRLRMLHAAFREHARVEERVALPALESLMGPQSLDALGREMRATRAAALARHRKANG